MLASLTNLFNSDIAFDVGTSNTVVYSKANGIVLAEPSVVAISGTDDYFGTKKIAAIGSSAKQMLGRTPQNIRAVHPLHAGVVADFYVAEKMLRYFMRRVHADSIFKPKPRVLVTIPSDANSIEQKVIKEALTNAGAKQVFLLAKPTAAALGAGLAVLSSKGGMVVDVGAGTTEIGVISLGGLAYSNSIKIAGDNFNAEIINFVRKKHKVLLGESTAENLKLELGSAKINGAVKEAAVAGKCLVEGGPKQIKVSNVDVYEAMQPKLNEVIDAIQLALELTPPELATDILKSGILLAGGSALLPHVDELISAKVGLPVIVSDQPQFCTALGGGKALNWLASGQRDLLLKQ